MKILSTFLLTTAIGLSATAQTTIVNGDFEAWGGNSSPGVTAEPTGWYSNKSGSSTAMLGPQTCFQDNTIFHSGTAAVRVETAVVPIIMTVVNGNVTTGVINAPSTNKADGYIGTVNYSTASDIRRRAFIGRPDSIVGWYQYTSGGTGEQGKVKAILHTGDYYDPETTSTYHPDATANKIGGAQFLTPTSSVSTWTRFSVPFTYTSAATPQYIMINITSSNDQTTTFSGSKLWLDDVQAVYNPVVNGVSEIGLKEEDVKVYSADKIVYVGFLNNNDDQSVISIYDLSGRVVFTQHIANNQPASFNLSYLNTGIYMYQLNGAGFSKKGKLFIQ